MIPHLDGTHTLSRHRHAVPVRVAMMANKELEVRDGVLPVSLRDGDLRVALALEVDQDDLATCCGCGYGDPILCRRYRNQSFYVLLDLACGGLDPLVAYYIVEHHLAI